MYITSCGIIGAVWAEWLARLFRTEIRGRVIGVSLCVGSLAGVGGALLAGHLIESSKDLGIYAKLYWFAAGIGAVSILMFQCLRDNSVSLQLAPPTLREVAGKFRRSLADRNFRQFLIGRMLSTAGFCIGPFLAVYYQSKQGGTLSGGLIVSCGAAQQGGMAIAMLTLGHLGDRHGHRIGILVGISLQVLALAIVLTSGGFISCLLAYACMGVCMGANAVSHMNILYETCPHDNRMVHITLGNLALALPAVAAPLLAGQVAQYWSLKTLFLICLALSIMALFWFIFRTRDPRAIMAEQLLSAEPEPINVYSQSKP
jgi:MFS family permease